MVGIVCMLPASHAWLECVHQDMMETNFFAWSINVIMWQELGADNKDMEVDEAVDRVLQYVEVVFSNMDRLLDTKKKMK